MELYSIFADHIWSIGYDEHEKDVLAELFEHWTDILYLSEYFHFGADMQKKNL